KIMHHHRHHSAIHQPNTRRWIEVRGDNFHGLVLLELHQGVDQSLDRHHFSAISARWRTTLRAFLPKFQHVATISHAIVITPINMQPTATQPAAMANQGMSSTITSPCKTTRSVHPHSKAPAESRRSAPAASSGPDRYASPWPALWPTSPRRTAPNATRQNLS